jgi:hypothetical protein
MDKDYKKIVQQKCIYFNMRIICEKAGINYSTYRGWKNNGRAFSQKKAKCLYETMIDIIKS